MVEVFPRDDNFLCENIFLIGNIDVQIVGNKLPSKKQILKVFFYHLRKSKLPVRESATFVVKEVLLYWEKAGIPTQTLPRCIEKLEKVYGIWRSLQKNNGKVSNIIKETEFKNDIEYLFHIAKAPEFLTGLEPAKLAFLEGQRQPTRVGFINNIESVHDAEITIEELKLIRERRLQIQREREKSLIGK